MRLGASDGSPMTRGVAATRKSASDPTGIPVVDEPMTVCCGVQGAGVEILAEVEAATTLAVLTGHLLHEGFLDSGLPADSWVVMHVRLGRYLASTTLLGSGGVRPGDFLYWRRRDAVPFPVPDDRERPRVEVRKYRQSTIRNAA
jgi:hypothetical protein